MSMFKRPGRSLSRLSDRVGGGGGSSLPFGTFIGGGYFVGYTVPNANAAPNALILAPISAISTPVAWKTSNTFTSGTDGRRDGLANSLAMNNAMHPAAQYCMDLSLNGYDDWYLPAINELLDAVSAEPFLPNSERFSVISDSRWWSSSQNPTSATNALTYRFDIQSEANGGKSATAPLARPVRRLPFYFSGTEDM